MTNENEELAVYNSARDLAKRLLIKNLIEKISEPGFDAINYCHLLAQEDGGENGPNPLHGIFSPETIAHAKKFIAASELLDQFYASIPEDPEAPIETEINEESEDDE